VNGRKAGPANLPHTPNCHHPRKRVIQYAVASLPDHSRHGILGRPVKPGDDASYDEPAVLPSF